MCCNLFHCHNPPFPSFGCHLFLFNLVGSSFALKRKAPLIHQAELSLPSWGVAEEFSFQFASAAASLENKEVMNLLHVLPLPMAPHFIRCLLGSFHSEMLKNPASGQ